MHFANPTPIKSSPTLQIRRLLSPSNVRRFSDCALHDMMRDMAGVERYPMRPAIREEA